MSYEWDAYIHTHTHTSYQMMDYVDTLLGLGDVFQMIDGAFELHLLLLHLC